MSASDFTPAMAQNPPPERFGAEGFHTTQWSEVFAAGSPAAVEALSALESLCQAYWYPLYTYARRQGNSPADAEDLTQAFFTAFLERNSIAMASPERGRFRNYMLGCFKNFLTNEHHRRTAAKRGGRFAFLSLDDTDFETRFRNSPADRTTPEQQYDHAWAMTLLGKVAGDLKADYDSTGKSELYGVLQGCLTGMGSDAGYQAIGASLGMSESAVKMAVLRLRQRYGQMLRREIAETLSDPSCVEQELHALLEAIARE